MSTEDKRFYGIYLGVCIDNNDPNQASRIKLQVPQVLGEAVTDWALPCLPVTDNANHPDHKRHLASEVAALLQAHATHATHTDTVTTGPATAGTAHTHTITLSLAHDAHTNNHTGKTPDTTYYLDHQHVDTSGTSIPAPYSSTGNTLDIYDTQTDSPQHTLHRTIPFINQRVWVMFIAGDPNFPVWMGVM